MNDEALRCSHYLVYVSCMVSKTIQGDGLIGPRSHVPHSFDHHHSLLGGTIERALQCIPL